jgi:two-component system sensor histidine kinase VicK
MKKVGFFRSIQLKFIIVYILLLLLAIQLIGTFFTTELEADLLDNFESSMNDRMELLSYNLDEAFQRERENGDEDLTLEEEVQQIVMDLGSDGLITIKVINNQSRVIGTNDRSNFEELGKKTTQEMVQQVLFLDTPQDGTLYNPETESRVFVQVEPILDNDGSSMGAIYLEGSLESVYNQLEDINQIYFQGSLLAVTVSAILGVLVARTITKPIKEMREQAQTMARGDFTQKVNIYGKDEIGQLAETFNDLNSRLKHSYATIEEERRKLSSILYYMSDGVIATDETGKVTLMNEPAGRLIRTNPDECIGEHLIDVLHLEERVIDIKELHDSGSMIIDFSKGELPYLIRANFSTLMDDEGEITGLITVISDVTEQEKVEQERRDFVSNVSHELRTPLTTLKSYIEALSDGAWEDKEIAPRFLNVAQTETERMIRMVNDLLQLSKFDSNEYALTLNRVEFYQYFHQVIDRFEMHQPEGITLVRHIPKGSAFVKMDKDRMTQVLDNIISNAIKYSPEGGEIHLRVNKWKKQLLISIEDPGIGISYDKLEKIFDRFYRADKARTRSLGGTGLGLAITKELVEAHRGQIWAKSKKGHGTTIFFTLPLMDQKRREVQ